MKVIKLKSNNGRSEMWATALSFEDALQPFLLQCRAKRLSPRTTEWYQERLRYLQNFLGLFYHNQLLSINTITPLIIREFIVHMQEREHARIKGRLLSSSMVAGVVRAVKIFFNFLFKEGLIEENPCASISIPKEIQKVIVPLTTEEIQKLLSVFDLKSFVGLRNHVMLLLFLDCMLRLSELINIKITDVNLRTFTIKVMGKGARERVLPIGMHTAKTLGKYLRIRGDIPGNYFLFVSKNGEKMKCRRVEGIVKYAGIKAGISFHLFPHLMRHSSAISWVRNNGDCFSLCKILGHSDLTITKRYVSFAAIEDLSRKHAEFGLIDKILSERSSR